jgi:hypothetical protein
MQAMFGGCVPHSEQVSEEPTKLKLDKGSERAPYAPNSHPTTVLNQHFPW